MTITLVKAANLDLLNAIFYQQPWIEKFASRMPMELGDGEYFTIYLSSPPRPIIGQVGLHTLPGTNVAYLKYGLLKPYRGKGYAKAACADLLSRFPSRSILATVDGSNAASKGLLMKLGFVEVPQKFITVLKKRGVLLESESLCYKTASSTDV